MASNIIPFPLLSTVEEKREDLVEGQTRDVTVTVVYHVSEEINV